MRFALIAALAGCAMAPRSSPDRCADASVAARTIVFTAPDGTSPWVERLESGGRVCAETDTVGFNFRHVKLPDGREGYVKLVDFQ